MSFSNTFKNSSEAIAAILKLHFPDGSIIDVNFGLGVFYKKVNRSITGIDLKPTGGVIADNKKLPFTDDSFDIGIIDPPYKRGTSNDLYTARYGIAPTTEQKSTRSYFAALPELVRVSRNGIIIKCQDASDGHVFYPRHFTIMNWMIENYKCRVHDIAVIARHGVSNSNTNGNRHFFQQAISYFLIYKWRSKNPLKPVIF